MSDQKGCVKCGCTTTTQKEIATTGTGLSKLLDIQHNKFIVISCTDCGYSELYNKKSSTAGNIVDLFFGG
ncbi:hypothetical protein CIB95_00525 [Lottiidibacillus patelloidae]|uniref:Nucleic acid-binding protein n=1 Tax=Lottiidibacillus patelloidae TaxID=2670334 RepID=A0A263BXR5_9BACI|nr:zinc ribbon domain-containing protein [Lottiidibacillus patelloidae]OZM58097.1 hypothetical protein CIB95_00525 [Lottiidibacillus patelloidae]